MYFGFEGFDTKNGTNHLAIKMIDEFLIDGIDVYLMISHTTGTFDDIPNVLKGRDGFTYDIVDRAIVSKKNFIQRYLDGASYALNAWKKWRKRIKDVDVVIYQSTPTALFSMVLLYFFGRKPIIYNNYDIFPDGSFALGAIRNKYVYKILHTFQKIVYKLSDRIVVISEDMKEQFINNGVADEKLIEIKLWYDDNTIQSVPHMENDFILNNNINPNKFYVQYAGNFGYTFDYKMVLDIAEKLIEKKDIVFQMIGDGAFRCDFIEEAKKRNLTNIKFYPWQPLELISDVYSACDVQIIPLSKGVIKNSFPSKSSILMSIGKTILCTTESDSYFYKEMNVKNIGICVSNDSPEDAAKELKLLYNNQKKLEEISENAKKHAKEVYSSSVNVLKFIDLVNEYDKNAKIVKDKNYSIK